ncbi:hypothetical protein KFK09_019236 [Dendrobium nobile]|uniref:Uncharacterized protein n=1 Tax=Dendrobium nobile TaxID=94219 RepID=A0A8T3AYJ1_DENNO|nr:hypothetical protein KFK09_019236 [Dendrobium nobile]
MFSPLFSEEKGRGEGKLLHCFFRILVLHAYKMKTQNTNDSTSNKRYVLVFFIAFSSFPHTVTYL